MPVGEITTVLEPRPLPNFVETKFIKDIAERAMAYIDAGFPIHFRGGAGTGKTTIAMHVASKIGRPVVMIHGDEECSTSDLVGGEYGYRFRKVVDNFIHSVLKTEEDMQRRWVDNRLTVACKYGLTLIYDEFTRSRPEANNILLSILQEKLINMPSNKTGGYNYLKVDPNFTAIFTSNPQEYAGVFRSQDALRDRMITLDLDHFDMETEVTITQAKSGISRQEAEKVVRVVRAMRESGEYEFAPTVRGCIMIAKTLKTRNGSVNYDNKVFKDTCRDVLASETGRFSNRTSQAKVEELINKAIKKYC